MTYDVAIIGAGTAGVYAGYELLKLRPHLKVAILEMGNDIYSRRCPIVAGKVRECISCKPCSIMSGFGGAGAFSDGKYNFTTEFGGWLSDYLDDGELMALIDYVDSVNVHFGATEEVFTTDSPEARLLERRALEHDLHLLQARCKHLGTERNLKILTNIYEFMRGKCEFRFNTASRRFRAAATDCACATAATSTAPSASPHPVAAAPNGFPTAAASWACP